MMPDILPSRCSTNTLVYLRMLINKRYVTLERSSLAREIFFPVLLLIFLSISILHLWIRHHVWCFVLRMLYIKKTECTQTKTYEQPCTYESYSIESNVLQFKMIKKNNRTLRNELKLRTINHKTWKAILKKIISWFFMKIQCHLIF